jgi:uncharacterized protein YcaQ
VSGWRKRRHEWILDRLWDLATRVYPDDPVVPAGKAPRIRNERRLCSLGIARSRGPEFPVEPADVGEAGEPAVVEGVKGTWRVDPAQLGLPFSRRAALLSPFDRLVHDRKCAVELFEFEYQLEMYTSPPPTVKSGTWPAGFSAAHTERPGKCRPGLLDPRTGESAGVGGWVRPFGVN